jgi:hypothetical protein
VRGVRGGDAVSGQYIGVERCTDQTQRRTMITRLRSAREARTWLDRPKTLAFPALASAELLARDQNWHHRVRIVYLLPAGFRLPRWEVNEELARWRGSVYRKTPDDARADVYAMHALGDMLPTPEHMRDDVECAEVTR